MRNPSAPPQGNTSGKHAKIYYTKHLSLETALDIRLPPALSQRLEEEDRQQKGKLRRKLEELCTISKWRKVGRSEIIKNLSYTLPAVQEEALSMALKFNIGVNRREPLDYVSKKQELEGQ
ncbi:hypothetical protein E2C01_055310 [Portunus trituberculatus]|uniref:Uncharacterized protein n=1 Tax=Portunus trituberculatus TaxID=210409 RepID=A0A5B7GUD6_PORTR|nr:hypothetical protein [Portunus trituberculatus]